jgi:hypothetical protein
MVTANVQPQQVTYNNIFDPNYSVTGIRKEGSLVVITGSHQDNIDAPPQGLLYRGPLYPTDSSGYIFLKPSFPNQTVKTSVFYGPDTYGNAAGDLRAVGSYKYSEDGGKFDHGMMYQGSPSGSGTWTQIDVPSNVAVGPVAFTIPHSTMGDLVVGNYDLKDRPGSANAFIYYWKTRKYNIMNIGQFVTAYGIWQYDKTTYIITGGLKNQDGLDVGYLVDYDLERGTFKNLKYFSYFGGSNWTHFEGISSKGGDPFSYTMAAQVEGGPAFATIPRNPTTGAFGSAQWVPVKDPATKANGICTGNSVLDNNLIGIYEPESGGIQSYLAVVS